MQNAFTLALAASIVAALIGHAAAADEDPEIERAVRAIEARMEQMEQTHRRDMEELRRQVRELRARSQVGGQPSRRAESPGPEAAPAAAAAGPALSQRGAAPASTRRASAFNPAVTVFGNFLGRSDDRRVTDEEGDTVSDRLRLREVELDFRAAIDPWADGVVIATFEQGGGGDFEALVEEGYAVLKRLPVLDAAPAGLKLKVGRFRPAFGRLNKVHTHDLPQPTRPRALRAFLGEEGLIGDGAEAEFFLPTPGENNALSASLAVMNDGGTPIDAGGDGEDLAYLAHLGWFFDLGAGHDVEVGASAYHGKADPSGRLDAGIYGLDLTYKWKPYRAGQWRSLVVGAELFAADRETPTGRVTPAGAYGFAQAQLGHNTYLGLRYEGTQSAEDADLITRAIGAYLTYYTTEFLRLRFGLEHNESDLAELDGLDTALFELNLVFGSHPAEPYWVVR